MEQDRKISYLKCPVIRSISCREDNSTPFIVYGLKLNFAVKLTLFIIFSNCTLLCF